MQKVEKLEAKFNGKKENVIHITNLKEALNYALALKKVSRELESSPKIIQWYEYRAKKCKS